MTSGTVCLLLAKSLRELAIFYNIILWQQKHPAINQLD